MGIVTITKDDFEQVIRELAIQSGADWKYADESGVGEYVYYLEKQEFPESIVVRVCSTVNTYNDESRGTGEDSIKVMLWHTEQSRPAAGREYTQRIDTWKKNLKPKVLNCLSDWRDMLTFCPDCSVSMVIRTGKYGKFLGCPNYPDCEEKKDL